MARHHCRLRKFRKTARLSQRELAFLIGLKSQGLLSEIEAGLKQPSFIVALASALVLGEAVSDVFPGVFARAQRLALSRAQELHAQTEPRGVRVDAASELRQIIERLNQPMT